MTRRIVLYGYMISDGSYTICEETAAVIRRVFDLYERGQSYQGISDLLNTEGVIYLRERPLWNKHLIKRVLQNPKYIGDDLYPQIIPEEQFQKVQQLIQSKTENRVKRERTGYEKLWKYLTCGECGGHMINAGGNTDGGAIVNLKCRGCGVSVKMSKARLIQEVIQQFTDYSESETVAYTPSEDVIRLTNAINRGLERPDCPEEVINLIFQGVSARYACCTTAPRQTVIHGIRELNWQEFDKAVSAVMIAAEVEIALTFRTTTREEGI